MIFRTEVLVSWVSKYIPLCAFFPCPWRLCWGVAGGVLDSQGRFLHKRNFLCLSTETLDDATILCVLRNYANQCLMLLFKRSIVPANAWNDMLHLRASRAVTGGGIKSEMYGREAAPSLIQLNVDNVRLMNKASCLKVQPHIKLA